MCRASGCAIYSVYDLIVIVVLNDMRFDIIEYIAKSKQKHTQRVHAYTMRRRLDYRPSTSSVSCFQNSFKQSHNSLWGTHDWLPCPNTLTCGLCTWPLDYLPHARSQVAKTASVSIWKRQVFRYWINQPFEWICWMNDSMTHSFSDLPPPTGDFRFIFKMFSLFFHKSFQISLLNILFLKHQNIIFAFVTG